MTDVGAAERVEVDPLDALRVHRDVSLSAEEPEPVTVRRQVDLLGGGGTIEHHRVGAVLPLDRVAAVARIPNEGVVACAERGLIVAAVAVDRVVPIAADQRLDTGATVDRVVPIATVNDRRDDIREGAVALVDAYEVVARLGIDHDRAESVAIEAEVGRAVITDVDEENVRVPRL